MPKVKLTHRGIESFTAGKWLTDYMDDTLTGFGVRVHHTGKKVYFLRYIIDGTRRRMNLGTYPALSLADARDRAKELIGRLAKGEDPQAEKNAERQAETFGELAAEYLENHAKRNKRRWQEDERIIQANLLPVWKNKKAKNITRRDLAEVLDTIVARNAPVMANRTKALISKIYNYGLSRDIVQYNPCFGVPMPTKARQRDRVLSEAEIRAFWRALDHVEPVMAATFRMRLLTAQRGLEVLSMRWEQIRDGWWTIPPEVAKNGLAHRVPVVPQVEELLAELRKHTGGSVWVFASPRKRGARITTITRAAMRIAEAAGIENLTAHDLRRTAASHMTSMGIPRLVVSKILNHAESGITAVYDRHGYDAEKRDALERWAAKLEEILSGGRVTDRVASFAAAARA
ncbi:MAG: tyrosine-type recombinase/integrase [Thermoanaerobaculia bacterium]|nr:tyrosine-type recombinase/integrase [Thermoanaerobaculia bacterium]